MPRPLLINTLFDGSQYMDISPLCSHEGCEYHRMSGGNGRYLKLCSMHHRMKYGKDGFAYKKHRKEYCENIDGRLDFVCTTTIMDICQLDADHINGDPSDNHPDNIQTLCKCCHAIKTKKNKDNLSPGRTKMKLSGRVDETDNHSTKEEILEREKREALKEEMFNRMFS
jgi:hypothetical protein